MSVTMDDVTLDAWLLGTGEREPSVKFALWIASMSVQQSLDKNGAMAVLLRPYVNNPLPDREQLAKLLRQARGVFYGSTLDCLYYVEYLERAGKLVGLENIGTGYVDQLAWRDRVLGLVRGHGLAYKTVSFAAMLLSPLTCELIPVDRHVMQRLGYPTKNSPTSYKKYLRIEQEVLNERDACNPHCPGILFHWYKWEEYRQSIGVSKSDVCQSHKNLSVRSY